MVAVICGGLLGVIITLGRSAGAQLAVHNYSISLQVTPSTMALGALISIRGTNFIPHAHVGLTRDTAIPVVDTGNNTIIQADSQGSFTDTLLVAPDWQVGPHIIRAEDAHLHRSAAFAILVKGHSAPLRPAHLLLSGNIVDLGSGDQATNGLKMLTLTNAGGGQISWQATTTQPWLLLSPKGGTFSSGQAIHVMIAGERANLHPGSYTGQVTFTSNAGQATLPVKMQTRQLHVNKRAVLQLTPPVLAFTGADNGINPPGQVITVSNPGVLPLQWDASINGGNVWLSVAPFSGSVAKGGSQAVVIGVDSNNQLPGTYGAFVTFTSQAQDSPQSVYISLTIVPQCALQVSPGNLTFAGLYSQGQPAPKVIGVNKTQSCAQQLKWNAITGTNDAGRWLTISPASGTTTSHPSVSIDATGLRPGQYYASIMFITAVGTQTLPVTLIITSTMTTKRAATPTLTTSLTHPHCTIAMAPAALTFAGIVGQPNPGTQPVTIMANGTCTHRLNWTMSISNGAWITTTPAAGSVSLSSSARTSIGVALAGLLANTYTARLSISAVDSVTHVPAGPAHPIAVTLLIQPPCTLQAPSVTSETFNSKPGAHPKPASQSFTIGIYGACTGKTTITPTMTQSWLSITPAAVTIRGGKATFSVNAASQALNPGNFRATISLTAVNAGGITIMGSPQTIAVTLHLHAPPAMQLNTHALSYTTDEGVNPTSQTILLTNSGGDGLRWEASTPSQSWLSLGLSSGSADAKASTSIPFNIDVTGTGLHSGTYVAKVVITPSTGSAQRVTVTLTVN